jgi:hypothetical protein
MRSPGFDALIGTWTIEATHPGLPGAVIRGHSRFEWLDGNGFVVWSSHYDHPDIPNALTIIGDESMDYYDVRGVHRVFESAVEGTEWTYQGETDGFRQRFVGTLSDDGEVMTGQGQRYVDGGWIDDMAITYRRDRADLNARARRVIDSNRYMTLATIDPDGRPRVSPVYFTSARYADFYWISSPDAHHSRNVAARPGVEIVIFDSRAGVGAGEAAYLSCTARMVADEDLEVACAEAFPETPGAIPFGPDELSGDAELRLFVAHLESCDVHVPGRDPIHGRGIDSRQPADPAVTPA